MRTFVFFFAMLLLINIQLSAQMFPHEEEFTRQDSLRGSVTVERAWWDLQYYHLDIEVIPEKRLIRGTNKIVYRVVDEPDRMQIDLQPPMKLMKAVQDGQELPVENDLNAHFITLKKSHEIGHEYTVILHFEGTPVEAKNPPWDGGLTWKEDSNGLPFIASANQGIGASVWWPNKDHPYDEPDRGMLISVEVPEKLMDVSNGRLINTAHNKKKGTKTYHWEVKNPINNYGVNINIGDYVHFGEKYEGENGTLDMDYYVLRENVEKAKKHFTDAKRTIEAFEHWFGPYPFYEDSYKLVEVPYLGMEHQSSVTYGNEYRKGYRGGDLSSTGWGLKFDFIIVHESGHEWFANSITNKDVADMWIHESFTAYSESLFLDYHYGREASEAYVMGTRMSVLNDRPIIGEYNVNREGSGDMYYKGANMLHTIRQIVDNDEKWRAILRGINKEFYHQTVSTEQIENYMSQQIGKDLSQVFDQYLRDTRIPVLTYAIQGQELWFRWDNVVPGFDMPVRVMVDDKQAQWLQAGVRWNKVQLDRKNAHIKVDPNFYVASMPIVINKPD